MRSNISRFWNSLRARALRARCAHEDDEFPALFSKPRFPMRASRARACAAQAGPPRGKIFKILPRGPPACAAQARARRPLRGGGAPSGLERTAGEHRRTAGEHRRTQANRSRFCALWERRRGYPPPSIALQPPPKRQKPGSVRLCSPVFACCSPVFACCSLEKRHLEFLEIWVLDAPWLNFSFRLASSRFVD